MRGSGPHAGALALAIAGCAGGVPTDGGSPFASGADVPTAMGTGESGDATEPASSSSGEVETDEASTDEAPSGSEEESGAATTTVDATTGDVTRCLPTTDDCDGDGLCEAVLTTAETCGACDRSCVLPSTTLTCNAGVCEGVVSLAVIADAFIDDDDDDTNFGGAPYLVVVDDADTDVGLLAPADLGGIPVGATAAHAELVLACTTAGSPLAIAELTSAWAEQSVTWNDRPSVGAEASTHAATVGPNAIPITALVQAWIDAGTPPHGLQLATAGEAANVFVTRESSNSNDHPRIDVTVSY